MAEPTESDPLAETAAAEAGTGTGAGARPAINATATGVPSVASAASAAPADVAMPVAIGRYRVHGPLGQGAMGVVYAAEDPDLERRIALKVLRGVGSDAARARLLREARAMARLSHPAVVTVHEVGTAAGVDYVAMELIDGSTVAEWIAAAKPTGLEILEVFETAGRGLAAAHAAGLVHRDFKPHNVLRSKRGRVVVTDFGLARAALDEPDIVATIPGGGPQRDAASDAGSLSSTLTATGTLLGTPAYMAPEQHDGATVGPAADQFAYCVALWEALAGARPFPGQTLGAVRAQIERGPDPATEAKIPRRIRAALRRGLAVEPGDRFPTMDALLATIRQRPGRAWAVAAAGAVVIAAAVFMVARSDDAGPAAVVGCGAADGELATYTKSPLRSRLAAKPEAAAMIGRLDALGREWVEAQRTVCAKRDDPELARRLNCLAGSRNDLARVIAALGELDPGELAIADPVPMVADPIACTSANPPRRVLVTDGSDLPYNVAMLGSRERLATLPEPGRDAPCLRQQWLMTRMGDYEGRPIADTRADAAAAAEAADRCGDDRAAAGVTAFSLGTDISALIEDPGQVARVAAAVARAGGDRFLAAIGHLVEAIVARFGNDLDRGIREMLAADELANEIGVRMLVTQTSMITGTWLLERSGPGDLVQAEIIYRRGIELALPDKRAGVQRALYHLLAGQGRVDDAMTVAAAIVDPAPRVPVEPPAGSSPVTGRVVDDNGAPVAGARVIAQDRIVVWNHGVDPVAPASQVAVSAADGTFTIASVPPGSVVMAGIEDRRAVPVIAAPRVELRLRPTGSVHGRIIRGGDPAGQVEVAFVLDPPVANVSFTAPIAADGTWRIEPVPRGKGAVVVGFGLGRRRFRRTEVTIGATPVGPVEIEVAKAGVPLHVIVRNQVEVKITLGFVFALRGKATVKLIKDLRGIRDEMVEGKAYPPRTGAADPAIKDRLRPGDVAATLPALELGEVTVCAFGISGDLEDAAYMSRLDRYLPDMPLACVPATIADPDQVVVVEVPPMKRLPDE
jgi:hypothetical protein